MLTKIKITEDDVPEDLVWLCELVGLDRFVKIVETAGGEPIYIPTVQKLKRNKLRAAICEEYRKGQDVRALARAFGYSDRHIRTILQEGGVCGCGKRNRK